MDAPIEIAATPNTRDMMGGTGEMAVTSLGNPTEDIKTAIGGEQGDLQFLF
jgi:hypothetical protein